MIRVITQSLSIGHGDQKQIQRQPIGATGTDESMANQSLINPTELSRNPADPVPGITRV